MVSQRFGKQAETSKRARTSRIEVDDIELVSASKIARTINYDPGARAHDLGEWPKSRYKRTHVEQGACHASMFALIPSISEKCSRFFNIHANQTKQQQTLLFFFFSESICVSIHTPSNTSRGVRTCNKPLYLTQRTDVQPSSHNSPFFFLFVPSPASIH